MSQRFKFYLVVFLQIILILGMIIAHQRALILGEKILLEITPADPRSLFRGYYSNLNYEISRVFTPDIEVDAHEFTRGEYIYATLVKEPHEKFYKVAAINHRKPSVKSGEFIIRGRVWYIWDDRTEYKFFIQTDDGRMIEHIQLWNIDLKPKDMVALYINENNQITGIAKREKAYKPLGKDKLKDGKIIDIKTRIGKELTIKYGIENYFVEETEASYIDKEFRKQEANLYTEVSLGKDGRALISRIFLNDNPL